MRPISFKRHRFPPEIIRHAIWLYARFTLSFRDVEELLAERGIDASYETVRRWFLKFGPSIAANIRRSRPRPSDHWHLDEMVISICGGKYWLWRAVDNEGEVLDFLVQRRRDAQAAKKLMVKLLKKHGFAPSWVVTDRLRSYPAGSARSGSRLSTIGACEQTTGRRTRISRYDAENENCSGSNHPAQSNVSSPSMPPHSTHSPINVICCADRISRSFAPVHSALGPGHPPPHDACCPLHSPRLNADNVTKPPVERVGSPQLVGHLGQQFGTGAMTEHCLRRLLFARPRRADLCGATPCGCGCDGKCRFRRSAGSLGHGRFGWS
jgi:transposase-like protein